MVVKAFEFIYIHFHILDIENFSRFSWRGAFQNAKLIRNNLAALVFLSYDAFLEQSQDLSKYVLRKSVKLEASFRLKPLLVSV